jgi:hypothetical protein
MSASVKEGAETRFKGAGLDWPSGDVVAINAVRIAGKPDKEIRALVVKLEEARKTADKQSLLNGGV